MNKYFSTNWIKKVFSYQNKNFIPKTDLGKKLLDIRNSYISKGGKLLSEKDFDNF